MIQRSVNGDTDFRQDAHRENINSSGSIDVEGEGEFAHLGPIGYRALRAGDTLF